MAKTRTYGGTLKIAGVLVGGLTGVQRTGASTNIISTTSWDSGGRAQKIGGVIDEGQITATGFYDRADAGIIKIKEVEGDTVAFEWAKADGIVSGDLVVSPLEIDGSDEDGMVTFSFTGDITGAITIPGGGA